MDGSRFDSWTRARATTTNRRSVLGWSLTAGIAAALGRGLPANAQFGDGDNGSCTYNVTLTSSFDPSQTVSGTLVLDIGTDGAIDSGSLTLAGQAPASVVGQATGPAIDLLAALGDGTTLSLTGVAGGPVLQCSDPITGFLANPDTGQLGTWQTQSDSSGQSAAPVTTSGQTTSGQTTTTNPPPSGSSCPAPSFPCGPSCCPSGASCMDANQGLCVCPDGTIQCGNSCVAECPGDQFLDLDTCQCQPTGNSNCPAPTSPCGSGCCPGNSTCVDPPTVTCACAAGTIPCGDNCIPLCADGTLPNLDTCQCGSNCPAPTSSCGSGCCPGGSTCVDPPTVTCACAAGTIPCGDSCIPLCADGTLPNLGTCQCQAN